MASTTIKAGDLLGVRGTSWISRGIFYFTRGYRENPTIISHVAGFVKSAATLDEQLIVEAHMGQGVQLKAFRDAYLPVKQDLYLIRPKGLTELQRYHIAVYALAQVGKSYGMAKIGAALIDGSLAHLLRRKDIQLARRAFTSERWQICGTLWALAYSKENLTFGVDGHLAEPDDIWDYAYTRPAKYEVWKILPDLSLELVPPEPRKGDLR